MWIFTETGFVSAVMHHDDNNIIIVRARETESLDGIAALADVKIVSTPAQDYPWRVHVSRQAFQSWLASSVAALSYTNFKSRIHDTRGDEFYSALSEVWSVMHAVEERGS